MSLNYETFDERPVIQLGIDERSKFIANTYLHLLGAIIAFVAIEFFLFSTGYIYNITVSMVGNAILF